MTKLGAILYSKRIMGSRILTEKLNKKICNIDFKNYGSHSDEKCNLPYLTVAVAMGM